MSDTPRAAAPSRVALAVLVTLVVLSPWPFGSAHPRTTSAIAMIALATSLALLISPGRRDELSVPRWILWPLVGLWLLACLQLVPLPRSILVVLAPGPGAVWYPDEIVASRVLRSGSHPLSLYPEATVRWLAFVTGLLALSLLAAPALRDRRALFRASGAVVSAGFLVALYGLFARVAFADRLYGFLTVPTIAPFGPFVSKNHFAGYVEMAACLAVGLAAGLADEARPGPGRLGWLDGRHAGWIVCAWGAAGVLVLAVPVSLSRGGVVSLAAGLLAFVLIRLSTRSNAPGNPRALAAAAVCLVVAVVTVAFVLPPEARSRVGTLARTGTGGPDPFRLGVWRDSLRLAASSPLVGSGLGAFGDALPRFKTAAGDHRVEHAESDYLEFLAEGGGLAILLVALLALSVFGLGLRRISSEPHRLARGLGAGALAGLAAVLVHSAFDFNLRIPSNALLAGVLLAIVLRPMTPGAEEDTGTRRWPRRALVLLPLVAIATALGFSISWTERRLDTALLARATGSPAAALRRQSLASDAVEHLRRRPADAPAWVALGWLRWPESPEEAAALASWGVGLDPEHVALRRAAEKVTGAQIPSRRPW